MRSVVIVFISLFGLVGCTATGHHHNTDVKPDYAHNDVRQEHDGSIAPLPVELEKRLEKLAKVGDIGYVLVVGRHSNRMNVLRSAKSSSSRSFELDKTIPNMGIERVDSIGVVTYKGSHCVGSTFRYVVGGVLKEICY